MTLKAPRSKPQMLSILLSSVSAIACPMEVSPHITNLELAPVFCGENTLLIQCFFLNFGYLFVDVIVYECMCIFT